MKVSIVIPNWNGVELMRKHVPKVIEATSGAEIIITDDHSTDRSAAFIKKNFPEITFIESDTRKGYASNVNAGVRRCTGDIIVLLNTDVEPEKNFLKPLIEHFDDPNVFAVGCLDKSLEAGKIVRRGRGIARWYRGFFVHDRGEADTSDTAWVSGGSGAFRRTMWVKLGGMDTLYNPFYWEDIDLSYRARKAGWKILFEPRSVVCHFHEEGKIKREYTDAQINTIAYRNQFIFIWKNVTDTGILWAHILWAPIRILQTLMRGDPYMLKGYLFAISRIPTIIKHRNIERGNFQIRDSEMGMWV